jgi:hypothetical protein
MAKVLNVETRTTKGGKTYTVVHVQSDEPVSRSIKSDKKNES